MNATTAGRIVMGGPRYAMIDVRIDQSRLDAITAEMRGIPNALSRVVPPAMNKAAAETRTMLYREFSSRMNIARKTSIKDRIQQTRKASPFDWSTGVRIGLTRFTVASFKGTRQVKAGVQWSPERDQTNLIPRAFLRSGMKHYKTGTYLDVRQAWRRAMQSGEKLVPRYPIKVLRGPSLARVFSDDANFQARMETQAGQILEKKMQQQVNHIVKTT